MTKSREFWLVGLLVATGLLGAWWGWVTLGSSEPTAPRDAPHAALPPSEKKPDERNPSRTRRRNATEARRPHPITPLHETLAEERELIGALTGAIEGGHYERARALLGEAETRGAAEPGTSTFQGSVRGYHLILDCIDARAALANGPRELPEELLVEARKYLDEQRLPPRRQVRRVCVEGRPFARRG